MATPRERAFLATPFAGARGLIIAPFQFETTEDDNLRLESANSLASVVLAIQGRRRTATGAIEPFAFVHTPNTDRSIRTQDYKLGAGAILNLTIFASSGAPVVGQAFVTARFIRGLGGATIVLGTLLAGYVTAVQHLAYPGSPITSSLDGAGVSRMLTGTDPAAGSSISETVPTGAVWKLVGLRAPLTCGPTAGPRRPGVTLQNDVGISYFTSPQALTLAANGVANFFWATGMALDTAIGVTNAMAGLPTESLLAAGYRIIVSSDGAQADDDYDPPRLQVREWLTVA